MYKDDKNSEELQLYAQVKDYAPVCVCAVFVMMGTVRQKKMNERS